MDDPDSDIQKRPKRIILVRHGESKGNVDESLYAHLADSKIPLTSMGRKQAYDCGQKILEMIKYDQNEDWKVYFYVSPYRRTLQTLREIGKSFEHSRIGGVREEPRIREQDFGNFQNQETMRIVKDARARFGKFFFRFPEGESSADVYDRVTGFLDSLWRDISMSRLHADPRKGKGKDLNVVIVTHGLTMRVLLTRWFKWTTRDFEKLRNPTNAEVRVMEVGSGGEYSLAFHHGEDEMRKWGFSEGMVEDQIWRKSARKGHGTKERRWDCQAFFSEIEDFSEDSEDEGQCFDNGKQTSTPCVDPDLESATMLRSLSIVE